MALDNNNESGDKAAEPPPFSYLTVFNLRKGNVSHHSLMQTCRQIRTEFRPVLLRHPVSVDLFSVLPYIRTLYPLQRYFRHETEGLPGDIHIKVNNSMVQRNSIMVDCMRPFLQHLYALSNVTFKFTASHASPTGLVEEFNCLFKDSASLWKAHLGPGIQAVIIEQPEIGKKLQLYVVFKSHTPGNKNDGTIHGQRLLLLEKLKIENWKYIEPSCYIVDGERISNYPSDG